MVTLQKEIMSKIKVTETFYALQGEGRYVGTPSVFLRLFGCNLRCKNFGRSKEERFDGPNPEVAEVIKNIQLYKKLEELPLVSTGCDSYAAVYPEFKSFSPVWDHKDLAEHLIKLTPNVEFNDSIHLVITGGEPLLWQKQLADVVEELYDINDYPLRITFETNGTQMVEYDYMNRIRDYATVHFSISPKLSCSGEAKADAIKDTALASITSVADNVDFKFVIATQEDMDEVRELLDKELSQFWDVPVYLMPVGGLNESYQLNRTQVADLALKHGLKFSPRLQCDISENKWGS